MPTNCRGVTTLSTVKCYLLKITCRGQYRSLNLSRTNGQVTSVSLMSDLELDAISGYLIGCGNIVDNVLECELNLWSSSRPTNPANLSRLFQSIRDDNSTMYTHYICPQYRVMIFSKVFYVTKSWCGRSMNNEHWTTLGLCYTQS